MSRRRGRRRPLWIAALLIALLLLPLLPSGGGADGLELLFFDVGQGDATLVRTPDGRTALIDGGRSGERLEELLTRAGVERLDLVVATHADFDHLAGLVTALERWPVRAVVDNGLPHTTATYRRWLETVEASGARYVRPTRDALRTVALGETTTLRLLPPPLENDDQNDNSVGVLLEHGAFTALLPGDAESGEQAWWLDAFGRDIAPVELYKAAHHGSSTGDARWFLEALEPEVVVISAGLDNPYGHPHREALASYRAVGARILRTDLDGNVTVVAEPSGLWSVATGPVEARPAGGIRGTLERWIRELLALELAR